MAMVEVARFKLKEGADEQAFIAAERRLASGQITKQPGFISREAAKGANGEWTIILHWTSTTDAEAWTPKFMQDPDGQAFAAQLDFSSMRQDRYQII